MMEEITKEEREVWNNIKQFSGIKELNLDDCMKLQQKKLKILKEQSIKEHNKNTMVLFEIEDCENMIKVIPILKMIIGSNIITKEQYKKIMLHDYHKSKYKPETIRYLLEHED